jgi:hypothetical protein
MTTTAFQGEIQLAGWSESHNGGCKVTFWLADSDELEAFRAMTVRKGNTAGQRLACVLVEIGDDEQPVEQPAPRKDTRGPLCREACDYCAMPEFRRYVSNRLNGDFCDEQMAKDWILRQCCGIASRKELDSDPDAAALFVKCVRVPFMHWQRAGHDRICGGSAVTNRR